MSSSRSAAATELLDKEFPVLDKGFVRLVDFMGSDARIVQSARVSYGAGTKTVREDRGLIDYLLRNRHTSPFEQVVFTFHLKMPIFVARQWLRHRTARLNEISGRYSVMRDDFYVPARERVKLQSGVNKQGSGDSADPETQERVLELLQLGQEGAYEDYEALLSDGVSRELARINLPGSLYTEMYWQIDLNNLFHFLRLRLDWHAQEEIRAFSAVMADCARAVAPLAMEAFEEHILHGVSLSRTELELLRSAVDDGVLEELLEGSDLSKGRKAEFLRKLKLA